MTSSRTHYAGRFAGIVGSALTVAVLAGCGSASDDPSKTADPSPSGVESTDSAEQPPESQVVEVNGAQLQVPSDWEVTAPSKTERATLNTPVDSSGTSYGTGTFNADITLAGDTEELAEGRLKVAGPDAKRLEDVKFGGQTFFHIRELHGGIDSLDTYGTVIDGSEVTVAWAFNAELATREQIDEYINQVMPTFKFVG